MPDTRQTGLRTRVFRKSCVDFHWHFHPEIELVCVRKGSGVRYVGNSMEPFGDGDLCLIGSDVPHAFGSSPTQRLGAEWMVCHFLPEIWGEAFWRLPEMRRVAELLKRARRGVCFEASESRAMQSPLARLDEESGAKRLSLWLEILDRLARSRNQQLLNAVPVPEIEPNARLQKVLTWIEDRADDAAMSQAEAARLVPMSPQAFCRFFRAATGRPFHRYVNEVRVARAGSALLGSGRSIGEIAFAAGFGNLANFNRRFLEIAGTTPREYRKARGGLA